MTTEYRQTWRQCIPIGLLAGALAILWYRDLAGVTAAVGTAVGGTFGMRFGVVRLTPEAVVISRFGRRTIPWTSIQEVRRIKLLGGNGVRLVVDGRPIPLNAPVDTPVIQPDPAFEEKVATIERYWREANARGGTP
jgi:hypothetical protein